MRVVAGTVGGRRLVAPAGRATRPTGERVREAMFAALGSLGWVDGATVLDLYAGSGALGIEALSRGARRATFVERDRGALGALRANLDHTGLVEVSTVVAGTADAHLERAARDGTRWDLALVDPPYGSVDWTELFTRLPAHTAVAESAEAWPGAPGWVEVRTRRYGSTVVTMLARSGEPW